MQQRTELSLPTRQSSRIADALTPALYSRIVLRGPTQCLRTLEMLHAHPARARHVRALSLCPDSDSDSCLTCCAGAGVGHHHYHHRPAPAAGAAGATSRWGRSVLPDGYAVSSAVRRAAQHLEVLRCFVWDGEELPPYDDMWFALRISCVRFFSFPFIHFFFHFFFIFCCVLFFVRALAARVSSSSRRRLDRSCPRRTVMCV